MTIKREIISNRDWERRLAAYIDKDNMLDLQRVMIDVISILKVQGNSKKLFLQKSSDLWDEIAIEPIPSEKPQ